MATTRVRTEDLEFARTWLLAYEGESGTPVEGQEPEDDDPQQARLRKVAAWLDAEIARRQEDAMVESLVKSTGKPRSKVRAALRTVRARS